MKEIVRVSEIRRHNLRNEQPRINSVVVQSPDCT
jgi:hypothetical protein